MGIGRRRLPSLIVLFISTTHLSTSCALQEVVPTRPCVGNDAFVPSIPSEDDPISTWATTRVYNFGSQDGELIVWSRIRKWDAFVVVILMRIHAPANCLAALVVPVALLNGSVDIRLDIAC